MISPMGLFLGALIGAGLFLVVRELLPARPDMDAVLDRLENTSPTPYGSTGSPRSGRGSLWERAGGRILANYGSWLTVPVRDLDLLERSVAQHVGTKVLGAIVAFVMPQLAAALLLLMGVPLPYAPSLLISLGYAAYMWFSVDSNVRAKAREARREIRYVTASFLERAQLERSANIGTEAALARTAEVGDHWFLRRLSATFKRAELAGVAPWDALRELGDQLDIPELAAPAESFSLAGAGASIEKTLETQARMLRVKLTTDKTAEANAASEKLFLPGTLVFALVFAMFAYPAVHAMTSV